MPLHLRTALCVSLALVALAVLSACDETDSPVSTASQGGRAVVESPEEPQATSSPLPLPPLPDALSSHLGLGLMNNPRQLQWMIDSGVPWDYRYQYLTGGVNTGNGWTAWGWPEGSFLGEYLNESADAGYVPVLTYYQVVASAPDPGSEDVMAKLRNRDTMRAYFDEWESLMGDLGAFGGTVVVHVEPDLWAYMQLEDGDARKVGVAVATSGAGAAAGFDDSAAGFAQALVAARDRLAPNVLLGWHVSSWGTGKDLIRNHADPATTAESVASFYRSLGAEFDLVFLDASDRDAGWYEAQSGSDDHWWQAGDFARFESFVAQVVQATGRRAVLWQVPVGNTLYRSMDDSWGHYQDNRAQYWLGDRANMESLANAGVVAVLLGAGADGCTMYNDEMQDGVTNPSPINGNDREATYADDDGGHLRLAASGYYDSPPVSMED